MDIRLQVELLLVAINFFQFTFNRGSRNSLEVIIWTLFVNDERWFSSEESTNSKNNPNWSIFCYATQNKYQLDFMIVYRV